MEFIQVSDSTIILAIVVGAILLFISGRLPVMLVALLVTVSLYLTGLVTMSEAFAGFGDSVIIFIAGLFIVAAGLETTGVTAWIGRWLSRIVGTSRLKLSVLTVLMVALLSPLISMSGAVAAFVPVVTLMALRLGDAPSKYLIPLAFASGAGSKLALTGTPKNVLIAEASADAGYGGFAFFEFAYVGIPLLLGTILIVAVFGRLLLPERKPSTLPADFGDHARTLVEQYRVGEDGATLRLGPGSPLVGAPRDRALPTAGAGVTVASIVSGRSGKAVTDGTLTVGDLLIVRGPGDAVAAFADASGLTPQGNAGGGVSDTLFNKQSGLAEVVIPPRSKLIGMTMAPGMTTESGELVVVGVQRNGADLATAGMSEVAGGEAIALQAGDHLLLQGSWDALDRNLKDPEVRVVDSPELVRRQALPMGPGSKLMLAITAAMVVVLATGIMPAPMAVLIASMAVIGFGVLSVDNAYRAIDWDTVVLVAAMLPLSTAMQSTGTAERMADILIARIGDAGPYVLLGGLFIFTALLGQVISNTATAMILIPIAVAAAIEMDISTQPILMSLNVGASAAFLTPVATPPNLIVMGPGGYRFGDYWKLGFVLLLLYAAVAIFWVPIIWPL